MLASYESARILFNRYKREQVADDNEARAVARGLARLVVPVHRDYKILPLSSHFQELEGE